MLLNTSVFVRISLSLDVEKRHDIEIYLLSMLLSFTYLYKNDSATDICSRYFSYFSFVFIRPEDNCAIHHKGRCKLHLKTDVSSLTVNTSCCDEEILHQMVQQHLLNWSLYFFFNLRHFITNALFTFFNSLCNK